MKKIFVSLLFFVFSVTLIAQPTFNLGLKAGITNSKVTLSLNEIGAESILKYHIGAFGRVGFGRVFIQPEAYYSAKGGEIEGSIIDVASRFDFNTLDVPLLLGLKVIQGENAHVRLMGGPVFSILTSSKVEGDNLLDPEYYKSHYFAFQYGLGADLFGFSLDLRIENGANKFYGPPEPELDGTNNTFMISLGYKIF